MGPNRGMPCAVMGRAGLLKCFPKQILPGRVEYQDGFFTREPGRRWHCLAASPPTLVAHSTPLLRAFLASGFSLISGHRSRGLLFWIRLPGAARLGFGSAESPPAAADSEFSCQRSRCHDSALFVHVQRATATWELPQRLRASRSPQCWPASTASGSVPSQSSNAAGS